MKPITYRGNFKFLFFIIFMGISTASIIVSDVAIAAIMGWIVFLILILFVIVTRMLSKSEMNFIIPYVILGIAIRLFVAVLFRLAYADSGGLITSDEFYYYYQAQFIASQWKSGTLLWFNEIYDLTGTRNFGYYIFNALHFLLVEDKIVPVISNIFIDSITALILYKFTEKNFGERAGKIVFLLFIFNPHVIFWSSFLLKDTLIMFFIAFLAYGLDRIKTKRKESIAIIIFSLLSIAILRFYLAFIFIGILGILSLIRTDYKTSVKLIVGASALSAMILIYHFTPLGAFLDEAIEGGFEGVSSTSMRSLELAQSKQYATRLLSGYDPQSIMISLFHFLLSPSPLNWDGDGKYLFWGTLFWYFIMPFAVVGTIIVLKDKGLRNNYVLLWALPILFIATMILMPGINEPRHRLTIIPFATILASIGLTSKYRHKVIVIISIIIFIIVGVIGREALL